MTWIALGIGLGAGFCLGLAWPWLCRTWRNLRYAAQARAARRP